MSRWCDRSIHDPGHSDETCGPLEVARLFGTLVAETILASVHVRAHRQAGHMDASDLIKALQNTLRGGGRPHMVSVAGSWDRRLPVAVSKRLHLLCARGDISILRRQRLSRHEAGETVAATRAESSDHRTFSLTLSAHPRMSSAASRGQTNITAAGRRSAQLAAFTARSSCKSATATVYTGSPPAR